ncbi:hypothetical protein NL676_039674 [Syzygium grande]|nr:hypothetical protein NL676_039674 [Syzygium grande]
MNKRIASLQNQVDELRSMVGHLIKQKCHNDMDASSSKETFDPKKGDVTELGATLKRPVVCLEGKISDQNAVGSSRPGKVKAPRRFEVPDFYKYDGTSCPKAHLKYYRIKMAQYGDQAQLLMRTFHESLTGPALQWFFEKKIHLMKSWDEISCAFLRQYHSNIEAALSHEDLARTKKQPTESFKAFLKRWEASAAQVLPQLTELEMMKLFIQAMPYSLRFQMRGMSFDSFNKLILACEHTEYSYKHSNEVPRTKGSMTHALVLSTTPQF